MARVAKTLIITVFRDGFAAAVVARHADLGERVGWHVLACFGQGALRKLLRAFARLRSAKISGGVIRAGRAKLIGLIIEVRHPMDRLGGLPWEEVPVGVHRQRDARMPHERLDGFRVRIAHRRPSPRCVAERVEVQMLAFAVLSFEEVALYAPGVLGGIVPCHFQPCGASRRQVA